MIIAQHYVAVHPVKQSNAMYFVRTTSQIYAHSQLYRPRFPGLTSPVYLNSTTEKNTKSFFVTRDIFVCQTRCCWYACIGQDLVPCRVTLRASLKSLVLLLYITLFVPEYWHKLPTRTVYHIVAPLCKAIPEWTPSSPWYCQYPYMEAGGLMIGFFLYYKYFFSVPQARYPALTLAMLWVWQVDN